jgi:predicted DCC family thiol-disulfide oxidoreductase YuxK
MIIFYDGNCPLCAKEMHKLKIADINNKITLENIHDAHFEQRFRHIKRSEAEAFLHGQTDSGAMIYGLDVTLTAWNSVGQHRWLNILKLPLINTFANMAYWVFAKYRKQIAKVLCKTQCKIK